MKWPWTHRAEQAERDAEHAKRQLEETRQQWATAHAVAGEARRQGELNGWTRNILTIFSGHQ